MTSGVAQPGSSSIGNPDYWWFRAREELLGASLSAAVGTPRRVLDVGSADAPSVSWLGGGHQHVAVDLDPRGLPPGRGACASAEALPFRDGSFDIVGAFDVIEHCADEARALAEIHRVLASGGRLLASVPAYQWAWSDHDVRAGHHRRYTRKRLVASLEAAGFTIERATHGFAATFPFFAAERVLRRVRKPDPAQRLPEVSPALTRLFLALSRREARVLRHRDLPFGSSIFVVAVRR
jgi:SAM-dependent methyltransferase